MARMFTIVVAAGSSTRFGSNKLEELINGESILVHSVRAALAASDGVVVVTQPGAYAGPEVFAVVAGGATRSESVKQGLLAVPSDVEIIAIHDAARPGANIDMYTQGRKLVEAGAPGAVPAIAVVDTIKTVDTADSEIISGTLDRALLRAVQTPQIFSADVVRAAHEGDVADTDDSALVEKRGHKVVMFNGSVRNRKVTTQEDVIFLRSLTGEMHASKIGAGYDIHPFGDDENKKLVLGGVEVDHVGLKGHSDSDAVAHALTDALLSAIGAPDLGTLFPANREENKDRSSLEFLSHAVSLVAKEDLRIANAVLIINAQEPKLAPHVQEIEKSLRKVLEPVLAESTAISITPKHGEGVGDIGNGQAIAVYATVLLAPSEN